MQEQRKLVTLDLKMILMEQIIDDIALTFEKGFGTKTVNHLINCFGSAQEVYTATVNELIFKAELNEKLAIQITKKNEHRRAEKEMKHLQKYNITPLIATSSDYPPLLRECEDSPHVLYVLGETKILKQPTLSMVGTREITSYGLKTCDTLIKSLAEAMPELVIVSGLAFGVDTACHRSAVAHGLPTVGVLANALPDIYPTHHLNIAREMIAQGGAVVSEMASTMLPHKGGFLQRNRIIAGLGEGTIVVESPWKGGSMVTASIADGYQRVVMAVPGRVDDFMSTGTNNLIRSMKARMVCTAFDVMRELGWDVEEKNCDNEEDLTNLSKDEQGVLSLLTGGVVKTTDELAELSGMSMSELLTVLLELEFGGFVKALPGNRYERFYSN